MADLYWKVKAYLESKGKNESEIGMATKQTSPNVQLVNEGSWRYYKSLECIWCH
jgi:hypothetical protein